jgi:hypothetical protein
MAQPSTIGDHAARPSAPVRSAARFGWTFADILLAAFAIVALTNMETGLHGDPRTTNPDPGMPPYPPFLEITNWPLVTSVASVVLTVAFFGYLACQSIRQRTGC